MFAFCIVLTKVFIAKEILLSAFAVTPLAGVWIEIATSDTACLRSLSLKVVLDDIQQAVRLFSHIRAPGAQIDLFYLGEVS